MRTLKIALPLLIIYSNSFSQSNLGLLLQMENRQSSNIKPTFGFVFQQRLYKKNYFEAELLFRKVTDNSIKYYYLVSNSYPIYVVDYSIDQNFISVPVLYTFKNKILNLSIGLSFDFYLNYNETEKHIDTSWTPIGFPSTIPPTYFLNNSNEVDKYLNSSIPYYKIDNKLLVGLIVKFGKEILLNKNVIIEPFIYTNPILTKYSIDNKYQSNNRQFFGIGLVTKYKFR